ncbi:exosortase U [Bythopirellula polymerisocia]|uniref:Methanolan biosynthesis EpsI domain-containing protein n=1 Tax=Bythopirellula polymerisocia TaxID=2528003 RepID=A0A5C6CN15_9BACT|nr:exosortase U [Bythopirellula polymerisocia]TWU25792.1 hypothetical protein Pla144_30040 [Bythopirellula polymerisocia]
MKLSLLIGIPFALLGALQIAPYLVSRQQSAVGIAAIERAHEIDEKTLGELPLGWQVTATERINREENHSEGHYSTTFDLRQSGSPTQVRLSFDYPFMHGWHHLTGCYTMAGWECSNERVVTNEVRSDWPYVRTILRDKEGREAMLFFCIFDAQGTPLAPPSGDLRFALWQRIMKTEVTSSLPTYFQVQLFTAAVGGNSDTETELLQLFQETREKIRTFVAHSASEE